MFVTTAFVPSFRTRRSVWTSTLAYTEITPPDPHRVTIVFSIDSSDVICLDIEAVDEPNRVVILLWGPGDRVVDWSTYGVLSTVRWFGRSMVGGSIVNVTEILFEPMGAGTWQTSP